MKKSVMIVLLLCVVAISTKLAILDFRDITPAASSVGYGAAIANMILSEFFVQSDFELVEREEIEKIMREKKLEEMGLTEISKTLSMEGIDFFVVGSVSKIGDRIEADARMIDKRGEIIATASASTENPAMLRREVARKIVQELLLSYGLEKPPGAIVVGVSTFRNLNKESKRYNLGEVISEMLTTYMGKRRYFKLVDRKWLDAVIKEMKLEETGTVEGRTSGKLAGIDSLILGGVSLYGNTVFVDVRIVTKDLRIQRVSFRDEVGLKDLRNVVKKIGDKLVEEGLGRTGERKLISLEIHAPDEISIGEVAMLKVEAVYSDGSYEDVTAQAEISVKGCKLIGNALVGEREGVAEVMARWKGTWGIKRILVLGRKLEGIFVEPTDLMLGIGGKAQLTVKALYSDGSLEDVTRQSYYEVYGSAIEVEEGTVWGIKEGEAIVYIKYGNVKGGPVKVRVTDVEIGLVVVPGEVNVSVGERAELRVYYRLGSEVQDVTSEAQVIVEDESICEYSSGSIVGKSEGETKLIVKFHGLVEEIPVRVREMALKRLVIDPKRLEAVVGKRVQIKGYALYETGKVEDVTKISDWYVNGTLVDEKGSFVFNTPGERRIFFTYSHMRSPDALIVVREPRLLEIVVQPKELSLRVGERTLVSVVGVYEGGKSESLVDKAKYEFDENVIRLSEKDGFLVVEGIRRGQTSIEVIFGGRVAVVFVRVEGEMRGGSHLLPVNPKVLWYANPADTGGGFSGGTTSAKLPEGFLEKYDVEVINTLDDLRTSDWKKADVLIIDDNGFSLDLNDFEGRMIVTVDSAISSLFYWISGSNGRGEYWSYDSTNTLRWIVPKWGETVSESGDAEITRKPDFVIRDLLNVIHGYTMNEKTVAVGLFEIKLKSGKRILWLHVGPLPTYKYPQELERILDYVFQSLGAKGLSFKPYLKILSPRDGERVESSKIRVIGDVKGADEVTLVLNGIPRNIPVKDGKIDYELVLESGENTIKVIAENAFGRVERVVKVFYESEEREALWIELTWDKDKADLDLYVYEPDGKVVWYDSTKGNGVLDRDDTDGYGPEHYTLLVDNIVPGVYRIRVHYYDDNGQTSPVKCKVVVKRYGRVVIEKEFTLKVSNSSNDSPSSKGPDWFDVGIVNLP